MAEGHYKVLADTVKETEVTEKLEATEELEESEEQKECRGAQGD